MTGFNVAIFLLLLFFYNEANSVTINIYSDGQAGIGNAILAVVVLFLRWLIIILTIIYLVLKFMKREINMMFMFNLSLFVVNFFLTYFIIR